MVAQRADVLYDVAIMTTIAKLLKQHVTLTVDSFDRLYLNGYLPRLQTSGQLLTFLAERRRAKIRSPALLNRIGTEFRARLKQFPRRSRTHPGRLRARTAQGCRRRRIPRPLHRRGKASISSASPRRDASPSKGATTRNPRSRRVEVSYSRQSTCVNHYYFYLVDSDFGPAFIKVCSYAPCAIKICLNGHEWAKRQLDKEGIAYTIPAIRRTERRRPGRPLHADAIRYATRWIVERTTAWLQNYRRVLVRHDRLLSTYRAFVMLACTMIALGALPK